MLINEIVFKNKMKNKIIIIFLLTSCGSFSDAGKALRNEKLLQLMNF